MTITWIIILAIVLGVIANWREKIEPPPPEIEDVDDDKYDNLF